MPSGSNKSIKSKVSNKGITDNQNAQERHKDTKISVVIYEGKVEIRFNPRHSQTDTLAFSSLH